MELENLKMKQKKMPSKKKKLLTDTGSVNDKDDGDRGNDDNDNCTHVLTMVILSVDIK